ncbi:MAG: beta-L-arabinofuranosidase domain-containing protein, partial [Candidatus Acidiferrales bacterium]
MSKKELISRRRFVTSAVSAGAAACLLPTKGLFASVPGGEARTNGLGQSGAALLASPSWKDQGVENLTRSPHAKLKDIPVRAVTIENGFWGQRRTTNVEKSIPSMHDLLVANGRINNFLRLTGKSTAAQKGPVYSDSDVYKWTEAVGFTLQSGAYPDL